MQTPHLTDEQLKRFVKQVGEMREEELTLKDIAYRLGVSPRTLGARLKRFKNLNDSQ